MFVLNLQARAQQYEEAWERSIEKVKQIGGTCVEVDYAPFQEAAMVDGEMAWMEIWIFLWILVGGFLLKGENENCWVYLRIIQLNLHLLGSKCSFSAVYHINGSRVEYKKHPSSTIFMMCLLLLHHSGVMCNLAPF